MPKVSQEHQESRRNQIIEAAMECFSKKGFHQTTMRDIVSESGLSPKRRDGTTGISYNPKKMFDIAQTGNSIS
jgi:hypothetical protein